MLAKVHKNAKKKKEEEEWSKKKPFLLTCRSAIKLDYE